MLLSLLIVAVSLVSPVISTICEGSALSVSSNEEAKKIAEMHCEVVIGNIFISGLSSHQDLPVFSRIKTIFGTITIEDTNNIQDSINFRRLEEVLSGASQPALTIMRNHNLNLRIGPHLKTIKNKFQFTYVFMDNNVAPIHPDLHNLLFIASYPNSNFVYDGQMHGSEDNILIFKVLASSLGFLFVFLAAAFWMVAFYPSGTIKET